MYQKRAARLGKKAREERIRKKAEGADIGSTNADPKKPQRQALHAKLDPYEVEDVEAAFEDIIKNRSGDVGRVEYIKSMAQFDRVIINGPPNKVFVVYFTAEWCGPCQAFKPSYIDLSKTDDFPDAVFCMNEDEQNKEGCVKYSIKAFPTLMLFVAGKKVWEITGGQGDKLIEAIKEYSAQIGKGLPPPEMETMSDQQAEEAPVYKENVVMKEEVKEETEVKTRQDGGDSGFDQQLWAALEEAAKELGYTETIEKMIEMLESETFRKYH
jgi:thiol-disulfide isomerase/thioredoxin